MSTGLTWAVGFCRHDHAGAGGGGRVLHPPQPAGESGACRDGCRQFLQLTMEKFLNLPVLASEQGAKSDMLISYLHWLMFVLFIGWLIFFLYTIYRFNAKRTAKADYHGVRSHYSSYLELAVAGIEVALLIFVAYPIWAKHTSGFPKESEATVIQVVGQQFAWNARYAGPDKTFGKQDMKLVDSQNSFGVDPADPNGKDDVRFE